MTNYRKVRMRQDYQNWMNNGGIRKDRVLSDNSLPPVLFLNKYGHEYTLQELIDFKGDHSFGWVIPVDQIIEAYIKTRLIELWID